MKQLLFDTLDAGIALKRHFVTENAEKIIHVADRIATCLTSGHKLLIFGNGGSAADAQHLAAEFVNRFRIERPPLAAVSLCVDTSILTSIGNDYHFDDIFKKQIQALGKPHDIAWGISTSGNSPNVIEAMVTAQKMGLTTLAVTGAGGGSLAAVADLLLAVDSHVTARVQEVHNFLGHVLCDMVDHILFPGAFDS